MDALEHLSCADSLAAHDPHQAVGTGVEREDDDEPVVILSADEAARLPTADQPLSAAAQAYLHAQGVTSPATWSAFRLDAVSAADLTRLIPPSPKRRACTAVLVKRIPDSGG